MYPGVVPLALRYEQGGLLFLFERTLWWSPDYGATWQQLEQWSAPPCDRSILGTPDLSVLYCVAQQDQQNPEPFWRSVDHGHTWVAVPSAPPVTLAGNYSRAYSLYSLMVLRDGSLLGFYSVPAATPSGTPPRPTPQSSAFYSLAPNANVWRQASEPLNGILATQVTWASGPQGTQALYIGQQIVQAPSVAPAVVGEITWGGARCRVVSVSRPTVSCSEGRGLRLRSAKLSWVAVRRREASHYPSSPRSDRPPRTRATGIRCVRRAPRGYMRCAAGVEFLTRQRVCCLGTLAAMAAH
jgi:hypothetical protein